MSKITNSSYFLPNIIATEAHDRFESGRTKPMIIEGVCSKSFEKSSYVVKMLGLEMTHQSFINELICAFIAMELDLKVPLPAIINFEETFIETLEGKDVYQVSKQSIGYNFGGELITGYTEFIKGQTLTKSQFSQAIKIFIFDLFILNPDRGVNKLKQNMFTNGKDICIFDHEAALCFLYQLRSNTTPWRLMPYDIGWVSKHHFFDYIRGNDKVELDFIDTFVRLDTKFWDKVQELIPVEWNSENVIKIRDYLTTIVNNSGLFKEQIREILK